MYSANIPKWQASYNYYKLHMVSGFACMLFTDTVSQAVVHGKEMLLVLRDLTTDKALQVII